MEEKKQELVSHPDHYKWLKDKIGIEPYIICQVFNFNIGNCLKYLFRAGKKLYKDCDEQQSYLTDLMKAKQYIDFEIKRVTSESFNKQIKKGEEIINMMEGPFHTVQL